MFDRTLLSGSRSIRSLADDILNSARLENVPNELIQKQVNALNEIADRMTQLHFTINESSSVVAGGMRRR